MAERTGLTFVSLQTEKVKEEINTLIKTYANLALAVEKTKEFTGIKSDRDLSAEVNRIIDQIKIVQRSLKKINESLLDLKLENFNTAIDNFYRKAITKTQKLKEQREIEHKKIMDAIGEWQEKAKKI